MGKRSNFERREADFTRRVGTLTTMIRADRTPAIRKEAMR